jgi:hypothetical protein
MTDTVLKTTLQPLPLRETLPWFVIGGMLVITLIYFVGVEEGAMSVLSGLPFHEFLHDGRHLIGIPCH